MHSHYSLLLQYVILHHFITIAAIAFISVILYYAVLYFLTVILLCCCYDLEEPEPNNCIPLYLYCNNKGICIYSHPGMYGLFPALNHSSFLPFLPPLENWNKLEVIAFTWLKAMGHGLRKCPICFDFCLPSLSSFSVSDRDFQQAAPLRKLSEKISRSVSDTPGMRTRIS